MNDREIREIVEAAILEMMVEVPQCECEGIPDMDFSYRDFCKCLKCEWYISRRRYFESLRVNGIEL